MAALGACARVRGIPGRVQLPLTFSRLSVVRGQPNSTTSSSGRSKPPPTEPGGYVNDAARELGVTRYYCNRNPRSLELLGMAEKPKGFATAHRRVDYYHRLVYIPTSRHSTAFVNHNNGSVVVAASTTELAIARHLYKTSDVAAAYNVGRVMAVRCKEMGLYRVMWEHKADRNHKKGSEPEWSNPHRVEAQFKWLLVHLNIKAYPLESPQHLITNVITVLKLRRYMQVTRDLDVKEMAVLQFTEEGMTHDYDA